MNKALLVLPLVLLSLLLAIWSGWLRLGWALPLGMAAAQHGALMVGSFLGTMIFVERAVTFKQKWVLLLPFINGLSVLCFALGQTAVALWCLLLGAAGFVVMCCYFVYRYGELYYYVFLAGAFALLGAQVIVYKTHFYPNAIPWYMAFLLFTIVAERLELSRFQNITPFMRNSLLAALGLVLLSLFMPFHFYGHLVFAAAMATVAAWLLRYDMAWKSLRIRGQHRYSAQLLITGYVWLLPTALLLVWPAGNPFLYDAALHSFFIGFVFSMIFSHAPIILPAVLRLPVQLFRPFLYVLFVLLQLSLLLRVVGDLLLLPLLRQWGGLLNGMVILAFFVSVGVIVRKELAKRKLVLR
ncbi:hypothetical protein SAMN05444008_103300 [Cnuella takakiae]|uniref:NnrS protein n=1 Tax=Cnuella takakiae TaxID=1302690 RepID=A0A1M4XAA7_9BACT|nr:hypothetical protein [Cnuella takakiae]OLY91486.1 hypothetical protein BUE76_05905 [Cnuella takakiae]SHE90361.1 hypothetical protein SAMN05444008_103300 [Cnuella takakiae]